MIAPELFLNAPPKPEFSDLARKVIAEVAAERCTTAAMFLLYMLTVHHDHIRESLRENAATFMDAYAGGGFMTSFADGRVVIVDYVRPHKRKRRVEVLARSEALSLQQGLQANGFDAHIIGAPLE